MTIDKKILSVDSDDDDIDIKSFSRFLQDDTKRNKAKLANEFQEIGEDLLVEIEIKKSKQEILRNKYIKYIRKYDKNTIYPKLDNYSFEDVKDIYDKLKNKKNTLSKILRFIFNV